jgi:hypothetical protein
MTGRVNDYAPRNPPGAALRCFQGSGGSGGGIAFAFPSRMKLLLASIAISALVLWALGCSGIHG